MLTVDRILLPTDFSNAAADAERRARSLARLFGADLHILHVTTDKELRELPKSLGDAGREQADRLSRHVRGWLDLPETLTVGSSTGVADRTGDPPVVRSIRSAASPQDGILNYAEETDTDIIVIGTRGERSARGPMLGTVADRVVRRADCPVVTVRPDVDTGDPAEELGSAKPVAFDAETGERLMVVPVDFSEPTRSLVAHAKHFAETFRARVDFVHVVEEPRFPSFYQIDQFRASVPGVATEARKRLNQMIDDTEGPEVDSETRILVGGDPASQIVEYADAQSARFILMATHGFSNGLQGLRTYVLGGVTDQVLRTAPCPVGSIKSYGRSLIPHPTDDGEEEANDVESERSPNPGDGSTAPAGPSPDPKPR
jgi:nucleotide-binding universal stress UspA family protein